MATRLVFNAVALSTNGKEYQLHCEPRGQHYFMETRMDPIPSK